MKAKFLYLLEEINENFTDKNFNELKYCFNEELIIEELFKENQRTINAINSAPEEFVEFIAQKFIHDINSFPESYFLTYEQFFSFFSNNKLNELYDAIIEFSDDNDNSYYYATGLQYLLNESPEIAIIYFNQVDDYLADYFISFCYQEFENYENSIISSERFLKEFNVSCDRKVELENGQEIKFGELITVVYAKWNTLNDLAYCYNMVKDYRNALKTYQISLQLISLEENFNIKSDPKIKQGEYDDFTVFVNNYLLALEKNGKINECIKILDFVIQKYPDSSFYDKQKKLFQNKKKNKDFTEGVVKYLIEPKKPFDIGKYEKTKLLSKEKSLEDMIVEQIKYGFQVFNKDLEIYKDENIYGRQYYISSVNGFLDLLLIDKKNDIVYVVELKRNEAGIEVVEQTEKYMKGLKKEIKNEIRGIICLHKPKKELIELVNKKEYIELFTYSFEFNKIQ